MKLIKVIIAFLFSTSLLAQLPHEIGLSFGGSNYIGDIGREFILPNEFAGGIIYKRNINPKFSLRTAIHQYRITDDDKNSNKENRRIRNNHFSNKLTEFAVGFEINYRNYDISSIDNTATPYIIAEFAAIRYDVVSSEIDKENNIYSYKKKTSFSIPFGLGFKSKLVNRFSYSIEALAHYTFTDDLDYNLQEIQSLQFGNLQDNDWYFFVGASLSYSFGRCPCGK